MREIKFRVYDKNHKETCYVEAIEFLDRLEGRAGYQVYSTIQKKQYWIDENNGILLQFTGLKDKNGIDIYEGDIVKFEGDFFSQKNLKPYDFRYIGEYVPEYNISQIKFEDGCYWVYGYYTLSEILEKNLEIEVIGNIYENRSLLDEN